MLRRDSAGITRARHSHGSGNGEARCRRRSSRKGSFSSSIAAAVRARCSQPVTVHSDGRRDRRRFASPLGRGPRVRAESAAEYKRKPCAGRFAAAVATASGNSRSIGEDVPGQNNFVPLTQSRPEGFIDSESRQRRRSACAPGRCKPSGCNPSEAGSSFLGGIRASKCRGASGLRHERGITGTAPVRANASARSKDPHAAGRHLCGH